MVFKRVFKGDLDVSGGPEGELKGNLEGDFKQDWEGDLLLSSGKVWSRSGSV